MKAVLLYTGWYLVYQEWLKHTTKIDLAVIKNLESSAAFALNLLGYTLIEESEIESIRTIGIDGTHGLWIGDPCNGIILFALFTGFVLAYPGPWKKKLWFIPFGLITIHIINIARIMGLAMVVYHFPDPEVLDFNHTYTFTILVYSYVFFLWFLWATKLSSNQANDNDD